MCRTRSARIAAGLLAPVLALLLTAGCAAPARRTRPPDTPAAAPVRAPEGGEVESSPQTVAPAAPSPGPVSAPGRESHPSSRAAGPVPEGSPTTRPAAPSGEPLPEPAPPALPSYVRVLERFDPQEPARVHVEISSARRLVIETDNVQRLRIDRARLPMATHRSIVLRLDGQGIEWTPRSTVREFQRSPNGVWSAVRDGGK